MHYFVLPPISACFYTIRNKRKKERVDGGQGTSDLRCIGGGKKKKKNRSKYANQSQQRSASRDLKWNNLNVNGPGQGVQRAALCKHWCREKEVETACRNGPGSPSLYLNSTLKGFVAHNGLDRMKERKRKEHRGAWALCFCFGEWVGLRMEHLALDSGVTCSCVEGAHA